MGMFTNYPSHSSKVILLQMNSLCFSSMEIEAFSYGAPFTCTLAIFLGFFSKWSSVRPDLFCMLSGQSINLAAHPGKQGSRSATVVIVHVELVTRMPLTDPTPKVCATSAFQIQPDCLVVFLQKRQPLLPPAGHSGTYFHKPAHTLELSRLYKRKCFKLGVDE